VPETAGDHNVPLVEVRMVPFSPTDTRCDAAVVAEETPFRKFAVFENWVDQVDPVGEVRMVPFFPTATYCDNRSDHVTLHR
jgi:hypothetical protein